MANAKRLESGNYRCFVYSHTDQGGKRHYRSFTAPTKQEAEYMAAEFKYNRNRAREPSKWTLGEAIDKYIELKRPVLSPSSIYRYEKIRKSSFQGIMDVPLSRITSIMLQQAVNDEMQRQPFTQDSPD